MSPRRWLRARAFHCVHLGEGAFYEERDRFHCYDLGTSVLLLSAFSSVREASESTESLPPPHPLIDSIYSIRVAKEENDE